MSLHLYEWWSSSDAQEYFNSYCVNKRCKFPWVCTLRPRMQSTNICIVGRLFSGLVSVSVLFVLRVSLQKQTIVSVSSGMRSTTNIVIQVFVASLSAKVFFVHRICIVCCFWFSFLSIRVSLATFVKQRKSNLSLHSVIENPDLNLCLLQ